jgi:ethanolamine kinase
LYRKQSSMSTENAPLDPYDSIRYINQTYNNTDSHNSALNLILTLRPEWRESKDTLEFVRFTDGITNTVCPREREWTAHRGPR